MVCAFVNMVGGLYKDGLKILNSLSISKYAFAREAYIPGGGGEFLLSF